MKTTLSELGLTPRECDLVRGIVAGRKNREMAHELGLSEQGGDDYRLSPWRASAP
jgi:FixJ family two-component response regulator